MSRSSASVLACRAGISGDAARAGEATAYLRDLLHRIARQREIGIRLSLEALRGNVSAMFLGQGTDLALVGLTVGIGAAPELTRPMRNLLYQV